MDISTYFKLLQAPLVNKVWSWESSARPDGIVVLRVWRDQRYNINGEQYYRVGHHTARANATTAPSNGYPERLDHLNLIRKGAGCILVLTRAKDTRARPRSIAGFDSKDVGECGGLLEHEGNTYIKFLRLVPRGKYTRIAA